MTTYKYKKKNVKAKTISFICDEGNEFSVQNEIRKARIRIGDTGSSFETGVRDIQVPSNQVGGAKRIITDHGCKVLSVKKDIDMKVSVRVK